MPRTLLILVFSGLCAGCAAIPLSTMWRFRDFTVEKFFANDPTQQRVADFTADQYVQ